MSGAPNVWAPNVPDHKISGRQMSGTGNVPTAYCLGHLLSREPNVPTPIVGRGSAGAKCTTTPEKHPKKPDLDIKKTQGPKNSKLKENSLRFRENFCKLLAWKCIHSFKISTVFLVDSNHAQNCAFLKCLKI